MIIPSMTIYFIGVIFVLLVLLIMSVAEKPYILIGSDEFRLDNLIAAYSTLAIIWPLVLSLLIGIGMLGITFLIIIYIMKLGSIIFTKIEPLINKTLDKLGILRDKEDIDLVKENENDTEPPRLYEKVRSDLGLPQKKKRKKTKKR